MGLLSGIRVVDFSRLLPGAAMTQLLADMGADVIKIERPGDGDDIRRAGPMTHGSSAVHLFLDRGKRSVALDLKTSEGTAAAVKIASTADAVVESFRPGVADQLGLSYEVLREHNPKLVVCSLNGYGNTGPRSLAAGHDLNYCAYAGILDFGGWAEEGPRPSGAQVADVTGGTLGAVGLLAAVLSASRTGQGTRISVALADAALWTIGIHVSAFLADGTQGPRSSDLNGSLPCYDVYECADRRYVAVGALEPKFWHALVHALNRPDLAPRQYDSAATAELRALFRSQPLSYWLATLEGTDACVAPVQRFDELTADPQFAANGTFIEAPAGSGRITQVSTPLRSPAIDPPKRSAATTVGEHTAEVLAECGVGSLAEASSS
ncbi:MAG TPA: CaiB/BaiF CoA-transferase family protein [Solirubrobacteraceae bacterium]|nr:CaiB/BaiF CoA-transferase family protein [Solirubrobacteraceae bacterium]